jgi:hypothetical protein
MISKINKLSKSDILDLIESCDSIREILIKIGYKSTGTHLYDRFNDRLRLFNIDKPKYNNLNRKTNFQKYTIDEILVENSQYKSNRSLKYKLVNLKLKEYKCVKCGNVGDWMGSGLTLQLEHINGKNNDNRLENLCFLCPNCHSQTKTYCGRNMKNEKVEVFIECFCGQLIDKGKNKCRVCINKERVELNMINRKVINRPDLNKILESVDKIGFRATGRKYGVSDNSIRKWIKWGS